MITFRFKQDANKSHLSESRELKSILFKKIQNDLEHNENLPKMRRDDKEID